MTEIEPPPTRTWCQFQDDYECRDQRFIEQYITAQVRTLVVSTLVLVRERDKAHEFEMENGGPLNSTNATIEAAGSTVAQIVRAMRR